MIPNAIRMYPPILDLDFMTYSPYSKFNPILSEWDKNTTRSLRGLGEGKKSN